MLCSLLQGMLGRLMTTIQVMGEMCGDIIFHSDLLDHSSSVITLWDESGAGPAVASRFASYFLLHVTHDSVIRIQRLWCISVALPAFSCPARVAHLTIICNSLLATLTKRNMKTAVQGLTYCFYGSIREWFIRSCVAVDRMSHHGMI